MGRLSLPFSEFVRYDAVRQSLVLSLLLPFGAPSKELS
jgi:hypothetical protein